MENYYVLSHAGIKGMKWGVRRYQNKDGTLTPEGRKRYLATDGKTLTKAGKKKFENKDGSLNEKGKQMYKAMEENRGKEKERVLNSRSAKELYDNAHLFTTQELQTAYNRLQLEKNIKSLAPKEVDKGEEYANRMIKTGNKISEFAEMGTRLYNNVAKIYNTFSEDGKNNPLPTIGGDEKKKVKIKTAKKTVDDSSEEQSKSKAKTAKKSDKQEPKDDSSDKSEGSDEKVYTGEVFGEGTSKGSQARKYAKAKKKVDNTIFDMPNPSNLPVVYTDRGQSYIDDEYF